MPHSGQRPTHLEDWLPHSWHAKIERGPFSVFTSGSNYRDEIRQLRVGVTAQIQRSRRRKTGAWLAAVSSAPVAATRLMVAKGGSPKN